MATKEKSWNDMSREEQDDRRKEERLMKRLFDSSVANRDLVIKKIIAEKGVTNPNSIRSEMARLNNLKSNFDVEQKLELKKSYENKWSQSSDGIQSAVNNQRIRQELSDFSYNLSNSRNQMSYIERQELNRKKLELQDQLRFSDAQLAENKNSWISQTRSEDDRLAAYNKQKDEQEYNESKYGKGFQGDPGGNATGKMQMQAPSSKRVGKYDGKTSAEVRNSMLMEGGYRDSSGATIPYADRNQGKPGQKGRGQARGMPQEFMQSPAMAQKRKAWTPYNARTGQDLKGEQLDDIYRQEAEGWRRGSMQPKDGITTNPYYQGIKNDQYLKNKRATEHSMTNYQNPSAVSNYYQNLYS